MGHAVDDYDLSYVSRTSWKAERRNAGRLLDVVPVTWTDGWRRDAVAKTSFVMVYYQDATELERQRAATAPFVIAVAEAHDPGATPRAFKRFIGVFEVVATGKQFDAISIEAKILRRLNGRRND